jgi:hypothetical protein
MKKVAEIGITVLGLYLIVRTLSHYANSFYSVSSDARFRDYVLIFGPATIPLVCGVLCIAFRSFLSGWIVKWHDDEIPGEIDLNHLERIILSLLGVLTLLEILPYFALSINQFIVSPEFRKTDLGDIPVKSYAFVQVMALLVELVIACVLLFLPQRVQALLRKTRSF